MKVKQCRLILTRYGLPGGRLASGRLAGGHIPGGRLGVRQRRRLDGLDPLRALLRR